MKKSMGDQMIIKQHAMKVAQSVVEISGVVSESGVHASVAAVEVPFINSKLQKQEYFRVLEDFKKF